VQPARQHLAEMGHQAGGAKTLARGQFGHRGHELGIGQSR
jgi:hypothetical protein